MTQQRLGDAVGLHGAQVSVFERSGELPQRHEGVPEWRGELRAVLEEAGIEFVDDGSGPWRTATEIGMTPEQCREARLALGMTQKELAILAGMSQPTLGLYERVGHLAPRRIALIRSVLERAGARFPNGLALASVAQPDTISGSQCREARVLLGLSQAQLAVPANVATSQVCKFEARGDKSYAQRDLSRARKLRAALEAAGVTFEHGRAARLPNTCEEAGVGFSEFVVRE